ncbi:uncharacterized protein BO88DRAFT_406342 [Aspergillus vadensis CBS 113365]|uniref:Uncharacterized protein n=1 Tax=Aspergillus vadensis (strain CBS 113365 / IMI 142717 / IBT 24658) TaxID=1448311 RepID=A0A319BN07_ASPVC|nr:hypothetical protein BO88DRAFT_406342 [Aspergillus vadensis CBS 113365]PYH67093.1 hypothetical protein BO88DRAFT_406342 [Aspergillus vadensis CBS 113365]
MGSYLYAVLGTSTCQSIFTCYDARKPRSARAMLSVLSSIGVTSCITGGIEARMEQRSVSVNACCQSCTIVSLDFVV